MESISIDQIFDRIVKLQQFYKRLEPKTYNLISLDYRRHKLYDSLYLMRDYHNLLCILIFNRG